MTTVRTHIRRAGALSLMVVIGLAACTGGASPSAAPNSVDEPEVTSSVEPSASDVAGFECPLHGGQCLGPIAAGTYTTVTFEPPITYTVPGGWTNGEDLPGNFLLQLVDDPRYLGIYREVAAPLDCQEAHDTSAERTVEGLTRWLTEHPGLVATEPEAVTVGGLDGVFVDISLDPAWTMTCPFSEGQPVVPFIIGGGVSSLHHVILPGFEERLYLLDFEGGNIAIEVGPEGSSLEEYLAEVMPIIDSLKFGS